MNAHSDHELDLGIFRNFLKIYVKISLMKYSENQSLNEIKKDESWPEKFKMKEVRRQLRNESTNSRAILLRTHSNSSRSTEQVLAEFYWRRKQKSEDLNRSSQFIERLETDSINSPFRKRWRSKRIQDFLEILSISSISEMKFNE